MERRTPEQICEHYQIEKDIAGRLRSADANERRGLYSSAYDELFTKVPHHPLLHNDDLKDNRKRIDRELDTIRPFLRPETAYLEIGPGDCAIAFEVARQVRKVCAIDVSEIVTKKSERPSNFELTISNGVEIPLETGSIDFAYSNQLMEHLHPDDSLAQLAEIYRVLSPSGIYYCVTPNRLSGPHDISRDFDNEATCLHLREFSISELEDIFRHTGFRRIRVYLNYRGLKLRFPTVPFRAFERMIDRLPHKIRRFVTFNKVIRFVLGVKLLAEK